MIKRILTIPCFALLISCSSPDNNLYYWGNYSDVVYSYYNETDGLETQEEALKQIILQAKKKRKPVAPGIYAHLGLILLKQNKYSEAMNAFQKEQNLYPESRKFMQYLQGKK